MCFFVRGGRARQHEVDTESNQIFVKFDLYFFEEGEIMFNKKKTMKTSPFKRLASLMFSLILVFTGLNLDTASSYAMSGDEAITVDGVFTSQEVGKNWVASDTAIDDSTLGHYFTAIFQVIPAEEYNTVVKGKSKPYSSPNSIYAYCIDLFTTVYDYNPDGSLNGQVYKIDPIEDLNSKENTKDTHYEGWGYGAYNIAVDYAGKESKFRSIIANSYPNVDIGTLIANSGIAGLTKKEAVHATQMLLWKTAHPGSKGIFVGDDGDIYEQISNMPAHLAYMQNVYSYGGDFDSWPKSYQDQVTNANKSMYAQSRQRIYRLYNWLDTRPDVSEPAKAQLKISKIDKSFDASKVVLKYNYEFTHTNTDGTAISMKQKFTLDNAQYSPVVNESKSGNVTNVTVTIPKTDFADGSEFKIYFEAVQALNRVDVFYPSDDNRHTTQTLISTRKIKESVTFDADRFIKLTKPAGYLDFTKQSDSGEPLAGAVFEIHDSGSKLILKAATGTNGKFSKESVAVGDPSIIGNDGVVKLEPGTYNIKEVVVPSGYKDDSKVDKSVTIRVGETVTETYTNEKEEDKKVVDAITGVTPSVTGLLLRKVKYTSDYRTATPIPVYKARLGIYGKDTGVLIFDGFTDEKGYLTTTGAILSVDQTELKDGRPVIKLNPGEYYVNEIEPPSGYFKNDEKVEFKVVENRITFMDRDTKGSNGDNSYTNMSKEDAGWLDFTKTDENGKPLAGAVFTISKKKHFNSDKKSFLTFVTDENGKPIAKGSVGRTSLIEDGKIYLFPEADNQNKPVIQEVKAPNGYELNPETIEPEIEKGHQTAVEVKNKKATGTLDFTKSDFATGAPVKGATMQIYKRADESDETGTLIFEAKTNAGGKFTSGTATTGDALITADYKIKLEVGYYYFVEKDAPAGYFVNPDKHFFEIKAGEIVKDTLTNEQGGILDFSKTDISGSNAVEGATMDIFKVDGGTETLIFSAITDDRGKFKKDTATVGKDRVLDNGNIMLRVGKYYFVEREAPKGYIVNPDKHYFEITPNGTVTDRLPNELKKQTGLLDFSKTDVSTAAPIEGATIEFYDSSDNLLISGVTDKLGRITQSGLDLAKAPDGNKYVTSRDKIVLPVGDYYFLEKNAPKGYKLNNEKQPFTITADGVTKATFTNEAATGTPGGSSPGGSSPGGSSPGGSSSGGSSSGGHSHRNKDKDKKDKDTPKGKTEEKPQNPKENPKENNPSTGNNNEPKNTDKQYNTPKNENKENNKVITEKTTINKEKSGKLDAPDGSKFKIAKQPDHGTVTIDDSGNWTFTPDKDYVGKDGFSVTIDKPDGTRETVYIDMTLIPLSDVKASSGVKSISAKLPKTGQSGFDFGLMALGLALIAVGIKKHKNSKK